MCAFQRALHLDSQLGQLAQKGPLLGPGGITRMSICSSRAVAQGTADAVRQYAWLFRDIKNRNVEDIVILSGDHLYRMDYMKVGLKLAAHTQGTCPDGADPLASPAVNQFSGFRACGAGATAVP